MKFILSLLVAIEAFALNQPPIPKEAQYLRASNKTINGGFENGTTNWTASGGSFTVITSGFGTGLRAGRFDASAASQTLSGTNYAIEDGLKANNGRVECSFKTTATDYVLQVHDGTNVIGTGLTIQPSTQYSKQGYGFTFPTSGNARIRILSASDAAQIDIDDCYLGIDDQAFSAFIQDGWTPYSPTIGGTTSPPTQGSGAVKTAYWKRNGSNMEIQFTYRQSAAGTGGSGAYLFPLPSGYLIDTNIAPSPSTLPTATVIGLGGAVVGKGKMAETSSGDANFSSDISVIVYDTSNLYATNIAGSALVREFPVGSSNATNLSDTVFYLTYRASVPIQGWGNSQYAVKADQTDFGWTATTLSISGSTSNPTKGTVALDSLRYRRKGENLEMFATYRQSGAGSAGSGAYLFSLPSGLVMDTSKISLPSTSPDSTNTGFGGTVVGSGAQGSTTATDANYFIGMRMVAYDSTRLYAIGDAANGAQAKTVSSGAGINFASNPMYFSYYASVPIQGWKENQRAPTLIGSVTSNAQSSFRVEYAQIANSGTCSVTSQSSSFVTFGSDPGVGACTLNFNSGVFSSQPTCWCNGTLNLGVQKYQCSTSVSGTTSVTTFTATGAGTDADRDLTLWCLGPR